jgi:ribonuclease BN (tRNA processing enzyme)
MAPLSLVPLGVGDAFSELHYSTSLALVAGDGTWLLIDCPHPIRKILREASQASGVELPLSKLTAVALTHLHADHGSGLEGLGYYFKYVLESPRPPTILSMPHVLESLRQRPESEVFNLLPVVAPTEAGPFIVEARRVVHGELPACAFRVRAGGRTLGHSGDTVFDPALIAWLTEADLAIHEAGALTEPNPLHTSYERLAALPEELRRRLRLAHYADGLDLEASAIEPLRPGRVYTV